MFGVLAPAENIHQDRDGRHGRQELAIAHGQAHAGARVLPSPAPLS